MSKATKKRKADKNKKFKGKANKKINRKGDGKRKVQR